MARANIHRAPPSIPTWASDVRAMMRAYATDSRFTIRVRCLTCRGSRELAFRDLERIADSKGLSYSLYNRRTRCRLTTRCDGWNVFGYSAGIWVYHLYDEAQLSRWAEHDRGARQRAMQRREEEQRAEWMPPGVDRDAWLRADARGRKLLVRKARG